VPMMMMMMMMMISVLHILELGQADCTEKLKHYSTAVSHHHIATWSMRSSTLNIGLMKTANSDLEF